MAQYPAKTDTINTTIEKAGSAMLATQRRAWEQSIAGDPPFNKVRILTEAQAFFLPMKAAYRDLKK